MWIIVRVNNGQILFISCTWNMLLSFMAVFGLDNKTTINYYY